MKNKRHIEISRIRISIWNPTVSGNWRAWLPSRGNVVFTLLAISALFWAQSAGAFPSSAPAAPTTSTGALAYQGRLADAGGTPLTGSYSMIFRLYNVAAGGAPLWTEQWTGPNSVQVSDGLFNVMLGSLNPIPPSIVTSNNDLWLGITVGSDNEMSPRVQLGSVPYAVQALTVPGGSITTTMLANASVTSTKMDATEEFSYVPTQETTTSTIPAPLPTADVLTITLTTAQWVNVYFGATANATSGKAAYMGLSVDGGPMLDESWIEMWNGSSTTIRSVVHLYLSAGTHTISARYFTHSGGTAWFWRRSILASAISQ